MHRSTEVLYPLSLEPITVRPVRQPRAPTATADPAMVLEDEKAFVGVTGSQSYLWRHTGCPGPYGTGCFRLTIHQNEAKCKRSTQMLCSLRDASKPAKHNSYRTLVFIRHWHRVSHIGAEQQCKLAKDKIVAWLNGIKPVESA